MEITKQNETFTISEKTENGWNMNGSFSVETNGNLNMNFSVNDELSAHIGNGSYSTYSGSEQVSVNYNVAEENRDEFTAYMDTVIDTVLERAKGLAQ